MSRISRLGIALGLLAVIAVVGAAVAYVASGGGSDTSASTARTVYLTALEYKGGTEAAKEPFPTTALPEGGGYGIKAPAGDTQRWEVNAYAWAPATIVVTEGDEVTLQVIGINGAAHPSTIEGHDVEFEVKRGQITTVSFTAGNPGTYQIVCEVHKPNMVGQLVVLAK